LIFSAVWGFSENRSRGGPGGCAGQTGLADLTNGELERSNFSSTRVDKPNTHLPLTRCPGGTRCKWAPKLRYYPLWQPDRPYILDIRTIWTASPGPLLGSCGGGSLPFT